MGWKLVGVVAEGKELKINGVNVWSQKWTAVKGEFADVTDPSYHRPFRFDIYTIKNGESDIKFAAGEFSNMVWGFYIEGENKQRKNWFFGFKLR
jgi:hypothetical protein